MVMIRKALLACGVISSLYYTGINIFVPGLFEGYDVASQTVSELSAIDAPTRSLWVPLASFYVILFGAFSAGAWLSSSYNRWLRRTAIFMVIYTLLNFYWPPMHLRGSELSLTDTLHITWAMVTLLLMMLIMACGAMALGRSFRIYTAVTFVVFIVFGLLIGMEAPGVAENLPTPHIGIWERINIGAFMLWIIMFAFALLKMKEATVNASSRKVRKEVVSTEDKFL
jgi:heme A synthase